jgi:hypothetical protein
VRPSKLVKLSGGGESACKDECYEGKKTDVDLFCLQGDDLMEHLRDSLAAQVDGLVVVHDGAVAAEVDTGRGSAGGRLADKEVCVSVYIDAKRGETGRMIRVESGG